MCKYLLQVKGTPSTVTPPTTPLPRTTEHAIPASPRTPLVDNPLKGILNPQGHLFPNIGNTKPIDSIGIFGLGLYSAGIFEKYAALDQQLLMARYNAIALASKLRKQFVHIILELTNRIKTTRENLESRLDALTKSVEDVQIGNKNASHCFDAYADLHDEIMEKIYEMEVILETNNKVNDITEQINMLNALSAYYREILRICRSENPFLLTQINDIQICVTQHQEMVDGDLSGLRDSIAKDIYTLKVDTNVYITSTVKHVEILFRRAATDFNKCVSASK